MQQIILLAKAMREMPGSPAQKKIKKQINVIRKKLGQAPVKESVNERISVSDERHFGKKGIIIMIDDNGKKVSAIFKDKKNAKEFNRNKPADIKKLLQLAKKTKYPKAIDESVNEVSGVDVAKKVLKNKQHEKGIDLQTANLIVTIDKAYDKNPRLQKKFRALQLPKMKQLILKYYG